MNAKLSKSQSIILTYSGELEVQSNDFILDADQLTIRDGEIAFMLSGTDGDGKFTSTGTAKLTSNGHYVSNQTKVIYPSFVKDDLATIQFDVVNPSLKKLRCKVEGKWVQGDSWTFSGNLRKFDPKQR